MKHLAFFIGIVITSVIVAVANVVVARITGFNVFSLKIWLVIPAGAAIVGFAAASGGLLAARLFHAKPNWFDAVAMMVSAAATMFLIYYLDYITMVRRRTKGGRPNLIRGFCEHFADQNAHDRWTRRA